MTTFSQQSKVYLRKCAEITRLLVDILAMMQALCMMSGKQKVGQYLFKSLDPTTVVVKWHCSGVGERAGAPGFNGARGGNPPSAGARLGEGY